MNYQIEFKGEFSLKNNELYCREDQKLEITNCEFVTDIGDSIKKKHKNSHVKIVEDPNLICRKPLNSISSTSPEVGSADDFFSFVENDVELPNGSKIKLYDYQKGYIEHIMSNRFNIGFKFRQSGMTTINLLWSIWKCISNENMSIGYVCHSHLSSMIWLNNATFFLSPELRPKLISANDSKICFENNSKIHFLNGNRYGRGMSLNHIIIDEAAYVFDLNKRYISLLPCLSTTNGSFTMISSLTPRNLCREKDLNVGKANYDNVFFDNMFEDALHKKNMFNPFMITNDE